VYIYIYIRIYVRKRASRFRAESAGRRVILVERDARGIGGKRGDDDIIQTKTNKHERKSPRRAYPAGTPMLCRRAREEGKYTIHTRTYIHVRVHAYTHCEGILNVIIKLAEHENNPIESSSRQIFVREKWWVGNGGSVVDPYTTYNNNNNNNKDISTNASLKNETNCWNYVCE